MGFDGIQDEISGMRELMMCVDMHAMALEWLGGSEEIGKKRDGEKGGWLRGKRVLDVGSGSVSIS